MMQLYTEFFNEDFCCLDEGWGEWLRRALPSAESLGDEFYQSLLRVIARQASTTNMSMEGILGEIKKSLPRRHKRGVNAEKQIYMGLLTQLMKAHLQAGNSDARKATRQDLLKQGVPLDTRASERQHQRPDTSWVMGQWHAWKAASPSSSSNEQRQKLADLWAEWKSMSEQDFPGYY